MIVSLHIIVIIAVLLIFALATPLFSPFFRKVKVEASAEDEGDVPPVSIVIVEHDSSYRLSQILPKFLSQDYGADYQVVVVIDQNDSESEDVLKLHSGNPHLYYTTLPITSRYLSRKKLGITLGMRAAKYDWVIVTDVHCYPDSEQWLSNFARHCSDEHNMVLGLTTYDDETPLYARFDQLRMMMYHLRKAQKGIPFITNQSVVMMRKQEFFDNKGFGGNLEYSRAEMEFLVNKYGRDGQCAVAVEPESRLMQFCPQPKRWRGRLLYALDAMKGLQRSKAFRFLYRFDLYSLHLYNLLTIAALVWGLLMLPELEGIILAGASVFLWIVSQIERCFIYSHSLRYYSSIGVLSAIFTEWTIPFRNLIFRIRYRFTDRNEFITHKL